MIKTDRQIKQKIGPLLVNLWNNTRRYAGFSDPKYYLPSEVELLRFLNQNSVSQALSTGGDIDCDDYAFILKGMVSLHARNTPNLGATLCIGIVWANFAWRQEFHACNWVLLRDGTLKWIEPKGRSLHSLNECTGNLQLLII